MPTSTLFCRTWASHVYPRSFFLVHAVAHGTEHRTEIKFALAQLA